MTQLFFQNATSSIFDRALNTPLKILIEAVVQRCSVKKVFLEIPQNSQENSCARVSFLINLQARPATLLKKRLWHRRFSVNFLEFLRTPFLWNTSGGCFCLNIFNTKLDYICLIGWSNSYSYRALKETRNSIKKWPLNLWWVSNKAIIEVGNITKAATFKGFLHLSYKNTQLLFCDSVFSIFQEKIINRWFLWVTQKYELRVSFKPPLNISESCSKNIFWFYCWKHVIVKHLKELS